MITLKNPLLKSRKMNLNFDRLFKVLGVGSTYTIGLFVLAGCMSAVPSTFPTLPNPTQSPASSQMPSSSSSPSATPPSSPSSSTSSPSSSPSPSSPMPSLPSSNTNPLPSVPVINQPNSQQGSQSGSQSGNQSQSGSQPNQSGGQQSQDGGDQSGQQDSQSTPTMPGLPSGGGSTSDRSTWPGDRSNQGGQSDNRTGDDTDLLPADDDPLRTRDTTGAETSSGFPGAEGEETSIPDGQQDANSAGTRDLSKQGSKAKMLQDSSTVPIKLSQQVKGYMAMVSQKPKQAQPSNSLC